MNVNARTVDAPFADIEAATAFLGVDIPERLEADDAPSTVVELLARLRSARQALANLEAFVEAQAVARLPYGRSESVGWIVEVRGGKDRKDWRHDDLAFAVCRDLAVDPVTGEISPEVAQTVDLVRSRLLNCAAVSYWRVTQLRPLGVDPDDYCSSTPGRKTVQLTPAVEGGEAA